MDLQLADKAALVFGGAVGLGAAICRTLVAEGATVTIADVNCCDAETLSGELGARAAAVTCDVGKREQVAAAVAAATDRFGGPHVMVMAVGLTLPDPLDAIDEADIDRTFLLNMRSHLWATRMAIPAMRRARYGRLIYLGSGSGMKGSAGLGLYSASKFFLRGLAHAAGLELGADGITANIVCPTDVYPEGDRPAGSWANLKLVELSCRKEGVADVAALRAKREARIPVRRSCTAQDVADAVAFLASPRAGFINAQTIGLNGGLLPT